MSTSYEERTVEYRCSEGHKIQLAVGAPLALARDLKRYCPECRRHVFVHRADVLPGDAESELLRLLESA